MKYKYTKDYVLFSAAALPTRDSEPVIFGREIKLDPNAYLLTFTSSRLSSAKNLADPKHIPVIKFTARTSEFGLQCQLWHYLIDNVLYYRMSGRSTGCKGRGTSKVIGKKLRHLIVRIGTVPGPIKSEISDYIGAINA